METKITIILAIITFTAINVAAVIYEASNIGKHIIYLDLAVQSLKSYLIEKYGLSKSDWDPYSYLGRPPLANYPILPFIIPAVIHKFAVKNIFLATCIGEMVIRIIPIVVWAILQLLNLNSVESTSVLLTYLLTYPIAAIYEVKYIRIATTAAYVLATTAMIIWESKLKRPLKRTIGLILWTGSLYSNFIYLIPSLIVSGVMYSPVLLTPIIISLPVLLFASETGKLEFDNLPESVTMGFSIFDVYDIILPTIIMVTIILMSTFLIRLSKSKRIIVSLMAITPLMILSSFLLPKAHYIMLKISKVLTQLDMYRAPLVAYTLMIVIVPKVFSKLRLSISIYSVLLGIIEIGLIISVIIPNIHSAPILGYDFSSPLNTDSNYRISRSNLGLLSLACPLNTKSGHPTYILGGGFYQGCCEVDQRVLSSVLFLNGGGGRGCCEQLAHPGQCQLFNVETARKVLALLPVKTVSYYADIRTLRGRSNVTGVTLRGEARLSLWDAIPVTAFRAVYIGSYTDYSFLWINLVRASSVGDFPMIPLVRPYNVTSGQSLSANEIPWSGDLLIVDSEALKYAGIGKLIRRAREVVVVYSSSAFDREPPSKVLRWVRRVRGTDRGVHLLGPVHHPLRSKVIKWLVDRTCVRPRVVHNSLSRIANDQYRLNPRGHRYVIVPWGWAPFWAVNGREGSTCPVGPYMLVKTDGKPTTLHYVAWERHQKRAYELSLLLLLASLTAAAVPRRNRATARGAEGRS